MRPLKEGLLNFNVVEVLLVSQSCTRETGLLQCDKRYPRYTFFHASTNQVL